MRGTTPEFIRWALEQECALRDLPKWQDPNRTERHLRAIRVYQDALADGRVFEGVAVEPENSDTMMAEQALGFRVDDVFEFYGDPESVAKLCSRCPANVAKQIHSNAWVGCFGQMPVSDVVLPDLIDDLPVGTVDLRQVLETLLSEDRLLRDQVYRAFDKTSPSWYGLWISRSPSLKQRTVQLNVIESLLGQVPCDVTPPWEMFRRALRLSVEYDIPIHLQLVPAAETDGVYWVVDQHCGRCGAVATAATHTGRQCRVCKNEGRPRDAQRRFVKGKRPYWKITRFLGEQGAKEYLQVYINQRGWKHVTVR